MSIEVILVIKLIHTVRIVNACEIANPFALSVHRQSDPANLTGYRHIIGKCCFKGIFGTAIRTIIAIVSESGTPNAHGQVIARFEGSSAL